MKILTLYGPSGEFICHQELDLEGTDFAFRCKAPMFFGALTIESPPKGDESEGDYMDGLSPEDFGLDLSKL